MERLDRNQVNFRGQLPKIMTPGNLLGCWDSLWNCMRWACTAFTFQRQSQICRCTKGSIPRDWGCSRVFTLSGGEHRWCPWLCEALRHQHVDNGSQPSGRTHGHPARAPPAQSRSASIHPSPSARSSVEGATKSSWGAWAGFLRKGGGSSQS